MVLSFQGVNVEEIQKTKSINAAVAPEPHCTRLLRTAQQHHSLTLPPRSVRAPVANVFFGRFMLVSYKVSQVFVVWCVEHL